MKKSLLMIAVLGLTLASCKKDRVCSCKTVTSYTGTATPPFTKPADNVSDADYTLVDVSKGTGRKACVHTKEEYPSGYGYTVNRDMNCALK